MYMYMIASQGAREPRGEPVSRKCQKRPTNMQKRPTDIQNSQGAREPKGEPVNLAFES